MRHQAFNSLQQQYANTAFENSSKFMRSWLKRSIAPEYSSHSEQFSLTRVCGVIHTEKIFFKWHEIVYSTRISSFALLTTENTIINSRLFEQKIEQKEKWMFGVGLVFATWRTKQKNHDTTTKVNSFHDYTQSDRMFFTAVVKCVRNNLFSSQFSYFGKTAWLCLKIGNKHHSNLLRFSFLE